VGTDDFYRNDPSPDLRRDQPPNRRQQAGDASPSTRHCVTPTRRTTRAGSVTQHAGAEHAVGGEHPSLCEIVRERSVLRRLVTAGDEIATSALNPAGRDTKQILDEAESRVFRIAERARAAVRGSSRSSRC